MLDLFSINNIAVTVLGYPLSYIELIGTLLYLWSVWLIARQHILTWPVGIASVLLYMSLFYQSRLYSDTLEQGYYLLASAYGWWRWHTASRADSQPLIPRYSPPRTLAAVLACTLLLAGGLGALMGRVHLLLPALFPQPAAFPLLDALTTIMSFAAMALMAQKRIESWLYWIVVDVIGIGLYYAQSLRFLSLLYVILLAMAVHGLVGWHRAPGRPARPPALSLPGAGD